MRAIGDQLSRFDMVIFDKDGTLIDFHTMWKGWAVDLVRRLEAATGRALAERLFRALEYDPATDQIAPSGALATAPMARVRALVLGELCEAGIDRSASERAAAAVWYSPDPLALARPLADLHALFGALRARGMRVAIATADDRAPTDATLAGLGLAPLVDGLACADDGRPSKPAPDAVLALCHELGVAPAQTVVVGDSPADLLMGRAAGVGLVVGVTSGVSPAHVLAPLADLVLPSVADLRG